MERDQLGHVTSGTQCRFPPVSDTPAWAANQEMGSGSLAGQIDLSMFMRCDGTCSHAGVDVPPQIRECVKAS